MKMKNKMQVPLFVFLMAASFLMPQTSFAENQTQVPRDNKEAINTLNDLIEVAKNGQEGYRTAAEGISDAGLRSKFISLSNERAGFVKELQEQVRSLGGDPEKNSSVTGAMHRGWINLKAAVSKKDEGAIIAECKRGDEDAVKSYEEALKKEELGADVRSLVEKQASQVRSDYDNLLQMERDDKVNKAKEDVQDDLDKAYDKAADAEEKADEHVDKAADKAQDTLEKERNDIREDAN
jgi:uncharacterized protein (TIGR02284 family)